MHFIKNNKGFTLLEVVLAVAFLAVIGVFIMQIFVSAAKADEKAKNMDTAANIAVSVIERFKSGDKLPDTIGYNDLWEMIDDSNKDKRFSLFTEVKVIGENDNGSMYSFLIDESAETNVKTNVETKKSSVGALYELRVYIIDENIANKDKQTLVEYTVLDYLNQS